MNNQWSKKTRTITQRSLESLDFASRDGKVFFKHSDGNFGYVSDDDALQGCYKIRSFTNELLVEFNTITGLLDNGWVLD